MRLHSTLTCLPKNTDEWYSGLDLGLVFIDLKQALYTVDHDILCEKLQIYGVQGRELSWFRSYLSNRKQFCRVNGVASDIQGVEVVCHRGRVLAPYSSSSTSMIFHWLSRAQLYLCMLTTPVYATRE